MPYPEGAKLRERREQLRLTQQQAAESAGVSFKYYQMLEYGQRNIRTCKMEVGIKICVALGIDPVVLLMGDSPVSNRNTPAK